MGPLLSQIFALPRVADPYLPGPQPVVVYKPKQLLTVCRPCCCGDDTTTNTPTYANVNFFYATCAATDLVGNLVWADTGSGQDDAVTTADANLPIPVIGAIVAKADSTNCTVQTFGIISGIYSNLQANTQYFLGHMGQVISTPFDNTIEFVQGIGSTVDSTTLYLRLSGSAVRRDTSG